MIEFEQEKVQKFHPIASIKVIGVGGAGGNTVNSIIEAGHQGFECIVANTDAQALELSKAENKVQIGVKSTKGLGTGTNPEIGKRAAEEDLDKIMSEIGDADIVFLAAGMGGGTGSGALPVIARALHEKGILSIAIVTKPFLFEGKRRAQVAEDAIVQLRKEVDTLIVIPNQKLLDVVDQNVSMIDAFGMINEVLGQSVRGISDIITKPGHINVDFADVRTIMQDRGLAVMGTGKASGEDRARKAAENAISSPLLENISVKGAHSVLLNITGGKNLGLHEISQAASIIHEQAHKDANIILGSVIDETLEDEVIVTIIATGFDEQADKPGGPEENSVPIRGGILDRAAQAEPEHVPSATIAKETAGEQSSQEALTEKQDESSEQEDGIAAASGHEHTTQEDRKELAAASETTAEDDSVDLSDLDVPAFLRKGANQEDSSNE